MQERLTDEAAKDRDILVSATMTKLSEVGWAPERLGWTWDDKRLSGTVSADGRSVFELSMVIEGWSTAFRSGYHRSYWHYRWIATPWTEVDRFGEIVSVQAPPVL